jgi:hypothetical protein
MSMSVERFSTAIDIYSDRGDAGSGGAPKLSSAYLFFKILLLVTNLIFMVCTPALARCVRAAACCL